MSSKPTKTNKKGGQPKNDNAKKWKDAKELSKAIDKYFEETEKKGHPYTMAGLALALGIDRRTLVNYSNDDSFFPLIKKARQRVEIQNEELLLYGKNAAGIIFNLKNNFGWIDKQEKEVELSGSVESYFKENPLNA